MRKLFAAASLVISRTNLGVMGDWICLLSDLLDDFNELSWESPLTVVAAVAGLLVGSLVGVIIVLLVV